MFLAQVQEKVGGGVSVENCSWGSDAHLPGPGGEKVEFPYKSPNMGKAAVCSASLLQSLVTVGRLILVPTAL